MKTIAALCMLMDHVGLLFFPTEISWRMIGRIAMPIFAYGIARGALYTTSLKKYMKKMLLFSLASQIPFWWMMNGSVRVSYETLCLNIGFTFLLGLGSITCLNWGKEKGILKKSCALIGIGICMCQAEWLQCDYGAYGVALVLGSYMLYTFNWSESKRLIGNLLLYEALTLLFYRYNMPLMILQSMGGLAYPMIHLTSKIDERRFGLFFYGFYPIHMLILVGMKWIGGGL